MSNPSVVVLGGGLSGMAAAFGLAQAGWRDITIVEAGADLGGLAGTVVRDGHLYPLTYHHILDQDRTLHYFLDRVGALPRVRWRKIKLLFEAQGRFSDFANPSDFLRFPMGLGDKARFVRLMLRCFSKTDWSDWQDRSAADLVNEWGGPGVRESIFDRLSQLKFELPCDQVSGSWLGSRLRFREGSSPLGYIPGSNWTHDLCAGLTEILEDRGVRLELGARVEKLHGAADAISSVQLEDGRRLEADLFVSTLPTETYLELIEDPDTPELGTIRYTAMLAALCATEQRIDPDFYWLTLASLDSSACGIFVLDSLNPTLGAPGDSWVHFVTHLRTRDDPRFRQSDDEILAGYEADFRRLFGRELAPSWTRVVRLPRYSPVFHRGYRNPPVRSSRFSNTYFAGNYRSFPSIASTGTALGSGLDAADAILRDRCRGGCVQAAIDAARAVIATVRPPARPPADLLPPRRGRPGVTGPESGCTNRPGRRGCRCRSRRSART
jgi:protoporphyrinogen oxidase